VSRNQLTLRGLIRRGFDSTPTPTIFFATFALLCGNFPIPNVFSDPVLRRLLRVVQCDFVDELWKSARRVCPFGPAST